MNAQIKKLNKHCKGKNGKPDYVVSSYLIDIPEIGFKKFIDLPKDNQIQKDLFVEHLEKFVEEVVDYNEK